MSLWSWLRGRWARADRTPVAEPPVDPVNQLEPEAPNHLDSRTAVDLITERFPSVFSWDGALYIPRDQYGGVTFRFDKVYRNAVIAPVHCRVHKGQIWWEADINSMLHLRLVLDTVAFHLRTGRIDRLEQAGLTCCHC